MNHPRLPSPTWFSALPARHLVQSRHVVWFRTFATSHPEAWDKIDRELVPLVVTAMTSSEGLAARIELMRISEEGPGGSLSETVSRRQGGRVGSYVERGLTTEDGRPVRGRQARRIASRARGRRD